MSSTNPFLDQTIEPDEATDSTPVPSGRIAGSVPPSGRTREPVVLTPTSNTTAARSNANATASDQEEGAFDSLHSS